MKSKPYCAPGDWLAECARCLTVHCASTLIFEHQTGFRMCQKCWEPEHPLDKVRIELPAERSIPWIQKYDNPSDRTLDGNIDNFTPGNPWQDPTS